MGGRLATLREEPISTTSTSNLTGEDVDPEPGEERPYRVLVVEDDRADMLLVEAALDAELPGSILHWLPTLPTADEVAALDPDCVLVDLGLPGLTGLQTLEHMLGLTDLPVIVLTGLTDRSTGLAAVARGAADYLVKGAHDDETLARAIRYAVERGRAQAGRARLLASEYIQAENRRMEQHLLPRPILTDAMIRYALRYQPGAGTSLLGGDFFDMVERPDGSVRLIVGDVSGHGPDEAALGVCLRIAWRTLVLRDTPDDEVFPTLDAVLDAEREDGQFCTACDVTISPNRRTLTWRLAGHPPPILLGTTHAFLDNTNRGVPLGVRADLGWRSASVELPHPWGLLVFTDGVFETLLPTGGRLELSGLLDLVSSHPLPTTRSELDDLLEAVQRPHVEAGHSDDLAVLGLLVDGT
jgi:serine phosphatase RsbU (regulator of sigma subunit)